MCWHSRFLFYTERKYIRKVCFPCQLEVIRTGEPVVGLYLARRSLGRYGVCFFKGKYSYKKVFSFVLLSGLPFMKLWSFVPYVKLQDSSLPECCSHTAFGRP